MKSRSAFAGAENIRVVVYYGRFVLFEVFDNLLSLHHANLALQSSGRLHASNPVTLPEDCGFDVFFQPCLHSVFVG